MLSYSCRCNRDNYLHCCTGFKDFTIVVTDYSGLTVIGVLDAVTEVDSRFQGDSAG